MVSNNLFPGDLKKHFFIVSLLHRTLESQSIHEIYTCMLFIFLFSLFLNCWFPLDISAARNPSLVEIRPLKDAVEDKTHPVYRIQETTPSCPPPKPPEHGHLQGSNYSLDASVHIFCDPGYTLTGQDHITCLRVPDPFKNVVAWEPMDMPKCQSKLKKNNFRFYYLFSNFEWMCTDF